jgi:hypothetical protein
MRGLAEDDRPIAGEMHATSARPGIAMLPELTGQLAGRASQVQPQAGSAWPGAHYLKSRPRPHG